MNARELSRVMRYGAIVARGLGRRAAAVVIMVAALALMVFSMVARAQVNVPNHAPEWVDEEWPFCETDLPENWYGPRSTPPSTWSSTNNTNGWWNTPKRAAEAEQLTRLAGSIIRPYWNGFVPECVWTSTQNMYWFPMTFCSSPGGAGSCGTVFFGERYCPPEQTTADLYGVTGCFPFEELEDNATGNIAVCPAGQGTDIYWPFSGTSTTILEGHEVEGLQICSISQCVVELSGDHPAGCAAVDGEGIRCASWGFYTGEHCDGTEDHGQGVTDGVTGGGDAEIVAALGGIHALLGRIHSRQGQELAALLGIIGVLAAVRDAVEGFEGGGGEGGGECEDESCTGYEPGSVPEAPDADEIAGDYWDRLAEAPIVSALSGMAGTMPVGECPVETTDPIDALGGATLTLNAHCQIWDEVSSVIYAVMLIAWVLVGGFIILRA